MSSNLLQAWFPTTTSPFVSSAPMYGVANGTLAAAVSKAGGLGFIGGGFDFAPSSAGMQVVEQELAIARELLGLSSKPDAVLPIGIGFVTFHPSVSHCLDTLGPILEKHKPLAIWLFAPRDPKSPSAHCSIIPGLKKIGSSWGLKVFTQVGTVAAAREAAADGVDAIVAQGTDAGGHQWARGAGIVSLVPEIKDMLTAEFGDRKIALIAAGGIADGRGVAAALVSGADGVTIGTKFIVSDESPAANDMKEAILNITDGGASTVKDTIHDDIQSTGFWPIQYDGRAVAGKSYEEYRSGTSLLELVSRYSEAASSNDNSRNTIWSGTGIGLVKERKPAGEIVKTVQDEARKAIKEVTSRL